MFKTLKMLLKVLLQHHRLKYIDKQCDKYLEIKVKLKAQQRYVNILVGRYNKIYGEDLRTYMGGGEIHNG